MKRFAIAVTGLALVAVVLAGSALGAVTTKPSRWYDNAVGLKAGESRTVSCKVGEHEGAKVVTMKGSIGEGAGIPVSIKATTVECVNHEGEVGANGTAKIEQTGEGTVSKPYVAEDFGRLKFSGITVVEPANCKLANITTNPLKSELFMDTANNAITFDKFEPTNESKTFASPNFENNGGVCSIAGVRVVKGAAYGQASNNTGVEVATQSLTFSPATETTSESTTALTLGGNPAHLTGKVENTLTNGHSFGAKES